jgi:hypothetical protein
METTMFIDYEKKRTGLNKNRNWIWTKQKINNLFEMKKD